MPETSAKSPPSTWRSWVCPAPLRDSPNIVMGHGGGGAMSAELIEHLFLPAFGAAADAEHGRLGGGGRRRRAAGVLDRLVRREAAVLPRRQHRRPGGQRHRQRPGDGRRAAAGAVHRVHPRGGHRARRLARVAHAIGTAALAAGVKLVTGDTKVVDAGTATACTSTPPASGWSTSASTSARSAPRRATW